LSEALSLMNDKKISCLFVENKMKPIGIVHIHDCLNYLGTSKMKIYEGF
jgi:CBS domain-containing protein